MKGVKEEWAFFRRCEQKRKLARNDKKKNQGGEKKDVMCKIW